MKHSIIILLVVSLLGLPGAAQEKDKSWNEKLNKRLDALLNPSQPPSAAGAPVKLPDPARLSDRWVPPPAFAGAPPRPGLEAIKPVRPRLTQEPGPLAQDRRQPELPQEIEFSTTGLIAIPDFIDVNRPIPVAILAQPIVERASLADATSDASIAAALAQEIPFRNQPAPFAAVNLPDPFEFRQAVKLSNPPPESETPMASPPRILVPPEPPAKK